MQIAVKQCTLERKKEYKLNSIESNKIVSVSRACESAIKCSLAIKASQPCISMMHNETNGIFFGKVLQAYINPVIQ